MSTVVEPRHFLQIFSSQFDEKVRSGISMGSAFKQIEGWSSLQALIITVAINDEWNVSFSDEDFRSSQTVEDLYQITKKKLQS